MASPYLVWRNLSTTVFQPCDGSVVQPRDALPAETVLRGDIVVRVEYGATERAQELRLLAHPEGWVIDPEWVRNHGPPGDLETELRELEAQRRYYRREETKLPLAVVPAGLALLLVVLCLVRLGWSKIQLAAAVQPAGVDPLQCQRWSGMEHAQLGRSECRRAGLLG